MYSVIKAPEQEEAMIPWFDLELQNLNYLQSCLLHYMPKMSLCQAHYDHLTFKD